MKNNEAFWNKIYEAFERIIFEEFTSKTIDLNFDNFYIKIYRKENQEDNNFISIHRKDIYNFLDAGYLYATNSHFSGCGSSKDLKLKFSEIKIAYHNETNEMIAVSVYNPYLKGNKCVGLTATTNEELREFGKEAIKEIIKYDINNYKSFYWCECADAIEHYYSKFGGFPIPNIYAREILEKYKNILKESLDSSKHYSRYSTEDIEDFYDIAAEFLEIFNVLKLYKFE